MPVVHYAAFSSEHCKHQLENGEILMQLLHIRYHEVQISETSDVSPHR